MEANVENDCTVMTGTHASMLPTQQDKNICLTGNNLSFHPIIVVHNLHSEFLPQLKNGIQYIVTSQCNDDNGSVCNSENINKINDENYTFVECENDTNCENYINQKPLVVEQMTISNSEEMTTQNDELLSASQALKNISPTEFLNITDYNACEISSTQKEINFSQLNLEKNNNTDINLDGFCTSPLKEINLDNENHIQDRILLDVVVPKVSIFSESSEVVDDIFVTSLKNQNEENNHCLDINKKTSNLFQEQNTDKKLKLIKNCELVLENNLNYDNDNDKNCCISKDIIDNEIKENICISSSDEVLTKSAITGIISNSSPISTSSASTNDLMEVKKVTDMEKVDMKTNLEDSNVTNFPLTAVDVGVISIMPVESVVLGNITLLPQTSSSIKFQVMQEDGSMKCVSVDPIFREETQAGISLNGNTDEPGATENTTLLAEVVTPSIDNVRPFKCELCSATFNRLGNYTRHKKIHTVPTKDQRFNCEVCGKNFIQRCDLTRHMHIHSGTEPHRCSLCGKGYLRHSDLIIHQRFHNKEKPFSCPHCTKGFCQKGDLNRHLRSIHFLIKPLTCGHCQKKFAKEATLIRHMQESHRDIILCSVSAKESEKRLDSNYGVEKSITIQPKNSAS